MGATSEFLARVPRRTDGKRNWPRELKARIAGHTRGVNCMMSPSPMRLQLHKKVWLKSRRSIASKKTYAASPVGV